eukprot:131047-Pelagomonas_calceolata.AAC.3
MGAAHACMLPPFQHAPPGQLKPWCHCWNKERGPPPTLPCLVLVASPAAACKQASLPKASSMLLMSCRSAILLHLAPQIPLQLPERERVLQRGASVSSAWSSNFSPHSPFSKASRVPLRFPGRVWERSTPNLET